jgi:excisionase family DNA binding protein
MKIEAPIATYAIPGMYTVNDAARLLGVSRPRVLQLIYADELTARRTAGDAYLVTAESLQSYQRIRQGNGRPWKPGVALAALWLLSNLNVDWITYAQRRRVVQRLKEVSAEELVWLTRRRATTKLVRISASFLNDLKDELVLSGVSSEFIHSLGLTRRGDVVEGYLAARSYDKIKRRLHLAEDSNTNATLHLIDECCFEIAELKQMPEAVALVDLAASADTRERTVALSRLKELLHAQS